jgi:tetratricopeptide (TPR) repeat protein
VIRFSVFPMLVTALVAMPLAVPAQSPRAQLDQLVQQLQSKPDNDALRENIINLALTIKPSPVLPDEAERHMARGIAAFKGAQSVADYQDAVTEFSQATLVTPWYGDAYYNLGVAQDKAEQYDAALRSLKLAQLASPSSKDIKDLSYQVEYRADRANSPEGKAEKEYGPAQKQFAGLIQKLDGAVFAKQEVNDGDPVYNEIRFYRSGHNNLLICDRRKKIDIPSVNIVGDWEEKETKTYVRPTTGGDFIFPRNGEFFYGCIVGRLSADGLSIDEINSYRNSQEIEILGVWHRQ